MYIYYKQSHGKIVALMTLFSGDETMTLSQRSTIATLLFSETSREVVLVLSDTPLLLFEGREKKLQTTEEEPRYYEPMDWP